MKKHFLLTLAALVVLVQGCIVKSLHPFYANSDLVFKKELINTWLDQDGNKWKISRAGEHAAAYQMTFTKDDQEAVFLVHLFQIEGIQFLDFVPVATDGSVSDLFSMHLLPSHSVAKVEKLTDGNVTIKWFNEKWLRNLFLQNKIKISHEVIVEENSGEDEDKSYVITASTEELRKFLMKYGNDKSAFEGDNMIELILKPAV